MSTIPYRIHNRLAQLTAVLLPQIPPSETRAELVAVLQEWLDAHKGQAPFTLALERLAPQTDPATTDDVGFAHPARARIKAVDNMGNVAFVRWTQVRGWSCVLGNGIPAAMSYAGIDHRDESATRHALEDAKCAADVLRIMQGRGSRLVTYTLELAAKIPAGA